jgi:proline iminopeptidase
MPDGVHLWAVAEGTGTPLVLCHGGPGLWDYLGPLAAELRDRHRVIRWDQRGCGRSDTSPSYGLEVALSDLQEVKRAFGIDQKWVVFGHSWGAYLALLSALEHPEATSALIYVSGTGTPSWWRSTGVTRYRVERTGRMRPAERERLDALAAIGPSERTWEEETELRRLSWMTDLADPSADSAALEAMATTRFSINFDLNRALATAELCPESQLLAKCEACHVPALIIHGSRDPRPEDGAGGIADHLPNARFVRIEGAGHLPWIEQPDTVRDTITSFVAETAPSQSGG